MAVVVMMISDVLPLHCFRILASKHLIVFCVGTLRGAWRYSVLCNVFTLFLSPPVESTQAVAVARHCLALLRSDMLLLRQLGGAGLWMQLSALVEHGSSNPDIVNEVKQVEMGKLERPVSCTKLATQFATPIDCLSLAGCLTFALPYHVTFYVLFGMFSQVRSHEKACYVQHFMR